MSLLLQLSTTGPQAVNHTLRLLLRPVSTAPLACVSMINLRSASKRVSIYLPLVLSLSLALYPGVSRLAAGCHLTVADTGWPCKKAPD